MSHDLVLFTSGITLGLFFGAASMFYSLFMLIRRSLTFSQNSRNYVRNMLDELDKINRGTI